MIRRPKATETEEDLLAFQEKFLSAGEKPSASVRTEGARKAEAGSKRIQHAESSEDRLERDVVNLQVEGQVYKPPAKRSKFKEERSQAKDTDTGVLDHHDFMQCEDRHITNILSEIQEHHPSSTPGFKMMSPVYTSRGFPTVQALDRTSVTMDTGHPSSSSSPRGKSLFAQQFAQHNLNYFGCDVVAMETGSEIRTDDNVSLAKRETGALGSQGASSDGRNEALDKGLHRERVAMETGANQSTDGEKLSSPSLISGEGLTSVGVSMEVAKKELSTIHQENVARLLSLPKEEILKEQKRVQQLLDPALVSFIKSRRVNNPLTVDHTDSSTNESSSTQWSSRPSLEGKIPGFPKSADNEEIDLLDGEKSSPLLGKQPVSTGWLHMDVVERNKMEWMTDVAVNQGAAPTRNHTNEVRFSVDGLVIPSTAILPSHLGLHHHGNEPNAAGYTLEELMAMCRSAILQQRTFGLQVLTRVVQRARLNEYGGIVNGSVLEDLFAAGFPLLLRYAIDESVSSVMFAAVSCLHALLVIHNDVEENVLDEYMLCQLGCVVPSLQSHGKSHDIQQTDEEESETDAEILQQDIILGYIEMKVLYRVRFILEMCSPPHPIPGHLLEIVIRIARHSLVAATHVMNCPRLVDVIFKQFLPLNWTDNNPQEDVGVVSGKPCLSALKLIRVLCAASENVSAQLVSGQQLMAVLMRYSIPLPADLGLPLKVAYSLSTCALQTWATLLRYGLGSELFRDTFPVLLKQLHCLCTSAGFPKWHETMETKRIAALFSLVESAINVACVSADQLKIPGTTDVHPPPAIGWLHVQGMYTSLLNCLGVLVQDNSHGSDPTPKMIFTSSLLHCLASYYLKAPLKTSPIDIVDQLETLFSGPLSALIQSSLFTEALHTLKNSSFLTTPTSKSTLTRPSPASFLAHLPLPRPPKPALFDQTLVQSGYYSDLVRSRVLCFTAADLVWGYVRFCRAAFKTDKGKVFDKVTALLKMSDYREYLEAFARMGRSKVSFSDVGELSLLYDTVKLLHTWMEHTESLPDEYNKLTFDLTYKLLKLLPPGAESMVWDLLSTVALHPRLLRLLLSIENDVIRLSLKDTPKPITLDSDLSSLMTRSQLLTKCLDDIPCILSVYKECLQREGICTMKSIKLSQCLFQGCPFQTVSLLLPSFHGQCLPEDWVLLPIVQAYNGSLTSQRSTDSAIQFDQQVTMVTRSLQLMFLLEHHHPHVLKDLPTSAKVARLMCVYLIDSDVFLEKVVHCYLASLLSFYCQEDYCQLELNFTLPIPGLSSFLDLYTALLVQFSAVSYGDTLFASYVLLPLQQRFAVQLRRLVWAEYPTVIRFLSIPLTQVPVSLDTFVQPTETDPDLLEMYLSALAAGTVRSEWSPLFYLVAVHHIHYFIFESNKSTSQILKRKFLVTISRMDNKDTKRHLLLYGGVNTEAGLGFTLKKELSDEQRSIVRSLLGTTSIVPDLLPE